MINITIYEPAMCCNTGICGPSPDKELVRLAADLNRLEQNSVRVQRYNLSQNPEAFIQQVEVKKLLTDKGIDILPIILVNGEVKLTGRYPTSEELEALTNGNARGN